MSDGQARQIKQMVSFIIQEADEKVKEIRIKTDHDFNLQKQNLIHAGKLAAQEEYAQKEKDLEIQERVQKSSAIADARVTKMEARNELLDDLKSNVLTKLTDKCSNPKKKDEYINLLTSLITQGLCKIDETSVEVQVLERDVDVANKALQPAIDEYKKIMSTRGKKDINPTVTVSVSRLANGSTVGGCVLIAHRNRIVVNQTMEARLDIAYKGVMPHVRSALFPTVF